MLVRLQGAKATISDCAITGYHCGVVVPGDSEAKIHRTLIAAMWHYGVGVQRGGKLHLSAFGD